VAYRPRERMPIMVKNNTTVKGYLFCVLIIFIKPP
jgi:hypothetical protein